MSKIRVLVANEPRSYREAISFALKELRSNLEVLTVEPELLDGELRHGSAAVVLCSHVTPTIEKRSLAWVELHPDGKPQAAISVDGLRLSVVQDPGLPNLLWVVDRVVDRAEVLARET